MSQTGPSQGSNLGPLATLLNPKQVCYHYTTRPLTGWEMNIEIHDQPPAHHLVCLCPNQQQPWAGRG